MTNIARALDTYNDRNAQAEALRGGLMRAWGLVLVEYGESQVDIPFPVEFTDRPFMSASTGELLAPVRLTAGSYPVISAMVTGWTTRLASGVVDHYIGCRLAVVFTGNASQKALLHWEATGPGLVGGSPDEED